MSLQLFGILNFTPDSFFDGGKNFAIETAFASAKKLLENNADYIDVGAEATNPFVGAITADDEINRLKPILAELLLKYPNKISLDTYHAKTLRWALEFGKPILNDVSGLYDPEMIKLAAEQDLICIVGHLPPSALGIPVKSHEEKMDSFDEVKNQLLKRVSYLQKSGIKKRNIILDPNIGFGKTMRLNWQLVKEFSTSVDYPVMIGASHKRFLGFDENGIELPGGQELRHQKEANLKAAYYAEQSGATYLRVHEPEWYIELL